MLDWTRAEFAGVGMTRYPVGPHLSELQGRFSGIVYLCIDVSGSMSGTPLEKAIAGSLAFVAEAFDAHYEVGIVLWDHGISEQIDHTTKRLEVEALLRSARIAGGTDIVSTLEFLDRKIGDLSGDRVAAIFGDGDLGNRSRALEKAAELRAKGVRILSCGLGDGAASALDEISSEGREKPRAAGTVDEIEETIANMAGQLTIR